MRDSNGQSRMGDGYGHPSGCCLRFAQETIESYNSLIHRGLTDIPAALDGMAIGVKLWINHGQLIEIRPRYPSILVRIILLLRTVTVGQSVSIHTNTLYHFIFC